MEPMRPRFPPGAATAPRGAAERVTMAKPLRPPPGRTNATVRKRCREPGMSEVLWSVTAKDYTTTDSGLTTRRVLAQASRDGIILLHDIYRGTCPSCSRPG